MTHIPPAALLCPSCFQEFTSDEDLAAHVGREHPAEAPPPPDGPDDDEMSTDG
jgi:hypothetical protein